ncbi:hypothetical protein GP486_001265 [Trichoglossum hirsutum]|uniref:TECPR1-like DysF domain-containing protein n=1 Tax=Trichoglossum hirsutum TaxID=265104 RepID=A0A9P8LHC2_9PEZI|nr:hypothetical protein GP486_001265 [Trichoglossum hirsutum]
MDEPTVDAVDRDTPIPVISLPGREDGSASDADRTPAKRDLLGHATCRGRADSGGEKGSPAISLQDRLFAKSYTPPPSVRSWDDVFPLLQQVIPTEDIERLSEMPDDDARSSARARRPNFSLPLMASNFRRFNARIGIVFVFQNRLIHLFSWRHPTHTLSFLAVYSFVCIDPNLLTVLPVAAILLSVMIPSFITRHPPPPTNSPTDPYAASGPPVAPPPEVKAVNEMSGAFFRNLRDLQNAMDDYSQIHDKFNSLILPHTNFSNEPLSSTVFLFLFAITYVLFLASHLLPWRTIFLAGGWFVVAAGHPRLQRSLLTAHDEHLLPRERQAQSWLNAWIDHDIIIDSSPETREVEIFELQKRVWSSSSIGEWEGWVFSPQPYDPLSPTRISGDRPNGTRFFEDVKPPPGWEWADKKWTLDLLSKDWVEERMITGVEVETEGERWVYDIVYGIGEEETLKKKKKKKRRDWEEARERGKKGEWRRRRWVRMVKRKIPAKMVRGT